MNQLQKKESFFLVSLMALALIGLLSATFITMQPDTTVNQFMNGLRDYNINQVERVASYEQILGEEDNNLLFSLMNTDHSMALFSKLEFDIESVTKSGGTATVRTQIKAVDMPKALNDYYSWAMDDVMDNAFVDLQSRVYHSDYQDVRDYQLVSNVTSGIIQFVSKTLDIKLEKRGLGWRMQIDDELRYALTGGYVRANGKTFDETNSVKHNLFQAFNYAGGTLWTDFFSDINSYVLTEQNLDGLEIDIQSDVNDLVEQLQEKRQYDKYVMGLDQTAYADVKESWRAVSESLDLMAEQMQKQIPRYNVQEDLLDEAVFQTLLRAYVDDVKALDAMTHLAGS